MADSPDAPQWDLLPHDPVGFFELADGFDRKDLKRSYNRLLRVFKPEKFPQEFQRIRGAYEELDEQLRYHGGAARRQQPVVPQDWQTDEKAAPSRGPTATPQPSAAPEPKRLVDRVATEPPAELFEELKQRANKSPYEYYALALLSDLVERSPTGFAKWIIEGIANHRTDGALKQLLHEYFRGPQVGKALLQLLPLVAKAVRSDEFYPLTEPAWQVVQRECSFRDFAATYDRCEAELRDSHIVGRMAFLIHMLKSAMWRDPELDGWAARQFAFIEENFESIPPWLEWDVELLSLAREYLEVRQQFARGSSLRAKMDAALKDYFSEAQEVGDRSVVTVQMEILASNEALMNEFPISEMELFQKFYPIWAWASHDVAERQSISNEQEVNENIWASRAVALLDRLEKECNASRTGFMWSTALFGRMATLGVIGFVSAVIVFTIVLLTVPRLEKTFGWDSEVSALSSIFGAIAAAIGVPWFLSSRLDQKIWFPLNAKFAAKCYEQSWRRELLDFQRRSHVPDRFFRALFAHFANKSATSTWVNEFVQQDFAPALLAGAQRYEA